MRCKHMGFVTVAVVGLLVHIDLEVDLLLDLCIKAGLAVAEVERTAVAEVERKAVDEVERKAVAEVERKAVAEVERTAVAEVAGIGQVD
jgi:hypothetical protein